MTRPTFDPALPDLSRRSLLGVSAAAFGLPVLGRAALAQGVPTAGPPGAAARCGYAAPTRPTRWTRI